MNSHPDVMSAGEIIDRQDNVAVLRDWVKVLRGGMITQHEQVEHVLAVMRGECAACAEAIAAGDETLACADYRTRHNMFATAMRIP